MGGAPKSDRGQSILTEIMHRMRTVDPDTVESPETPAGDGDHVVGLATPEIKCLFAVRSALANQHNSLAQEGKKLLDELQTALAGPPGMLGKILGGELRQHQATAERVEELQSAIFRRKGLHKIADKLLWLEIGCTFPELQDKPRCGIRAGWQICWSVPSPSEMMEDLLGGEIPENLRSSIEELAKRFANI